MNIPADKMGTYKDRIRFGATHSLIPLESGHGIVQVRVLERIDGGQRNDCKYHSST
jgi:hypothetical protein